MSRTVYVNGSYLPEEDAKVSVFDRGFLFADGVYEVSTVLEGRLIDNQAHLVRLQRSLDELQMTSPVSMDDIVTIQNELIKQNGLKEGGLYLQITRGAADRDFAFPKDATPSLVMFTQEKNLLNSPAAERGLSVISVPDIRWQRRDIKTVGLLAPALAKQAAVVAGADDAWMYEDGFVTEGSSNNAYIISKEGKIITRHLGNEILHGITRRAVLSLANEADMEVEERPFTLDEVRNAAEAFVTSATTFVTPVVSFDGEKIGDGKPGALTKRLRQLYIEQALNS
ncbi:D-amino acid aminotransferase [Kiloniella litopenaei]|uniref:Probable branched-chain-amino-acid aminotransferase n=1 Tax=Kiloniella litopenaei TaxID=1549748 RepID=A0A0M2RA53_9PROT|nr:D-amino-acid transaminase [Kiloniella litopenaei]KKJ78551.1 D-amino acid aminotransferase [Kiloniella litopenaei]